MTPLQSYHAKRQARFRLPRSLTASELQYIADARLTKTPWKVILGKLNLNPKAERHIADLASQHVGRDIRRGCRPSLKVFDEPVIAARPEVKSAFAEYDARKLRARGFTLTQIAALLRKPYREVQAILEAA